MIAVIWGRRYVELFARVALPSYLAPGNIPALADRFDLDVLIMTTDESVPVFEAEPGFAALQALCPVEYCSIDDLVTNGLYGVTLTLAYARGVRSAGADQTETLFLFMNSDFVLADGSLAFVADRMMQPDARCLLAPSLRVRSELATPRLIEAIDEQSGALAMAPRDMASFAFGCLHPTVIAKTVTQDLLASRTYNQIYWQVDDATLLARHHLIFMLAIRPERPMPAVRSYCDYGFVPDLIPSGKWIVADDSDDCLMLELQQTEQERDLLFAGGPDPSAIAAGLAEWTTKEQRQVAQRDIVFHSRALPSELESGKCALADFMSVVQAAMKSPPIDHVDHPYWTPAIRVWSLLRTESRAGAGSPPEPPPELPQEVRAGAGPAASARFGDLYLRVLRRARALRGQGMRVAVWHYLWPDCQLMQEAIDALAVVNGARVLAIDAGDGALSVEAGRTLGAHVGSLDQLFDAPGRFDDRYDEILVRLPGERAEDAGRVAESAGPMLAAGGVLRLWIHHPGAWSGPPSLREHIPFQIERLIPSDWLGWSLGTRYVGGRLRRRLRSIEAACLKALWPGSMKRLPASLIAATFLPIVAFAVAIDNRRQVARRVDAPPAFCTSILLTMRRRVDAHGTSESGGRGRYRSA
ncbi:MAG: hypothetical protein NXI21_06685 [Alphaproteobacteria bacterium]|nr:hypothetical protein [Alphaproteobacteria bacterium]